MAEAFFDQAPARARPRLPRSADFLPQPGFRRLMRASTGLRQALSRVLPIPTT
jgi:hypothetical protein